MALKIEPITVDRLGSIRRLFEMMTIEHLSTVNYPIIDEQEVDNFCVQLHRQLSNPYFGGWVAIRGHRCVGFLTAEVQERLIGKPNIFIFVHWLYVHPKHRQRGVARRLTAAGYEWSKTCFHHPLTHIEVFAQPGDTQWERRGFQADITKYVLPIEKAIQLFSLKDSDTVPMRVVR